MEKIITNLDQHGRMLIPSNIRERFKIAPGDKVTLEITDDTLIIRNVDHIVDELNLLFTKNQNGAQENVVEDFIKSKREEFKLEEARGVKDE